MFESCLRNFRSPIFGLLSFATARLFTCSGRSSSQSEASLRAERESCLRNFRSPIFGLLSFATLKVG